MKKQVFLLLFAVFVFISGCDVLQKDDPFKGIEVETFTTVDDLGEKYGLYYGFIIKNNRSEGYHISIQFSPKDPELKEIIGTQTVSHNNGAGEISSFAVESGEEISIGKTIAIPKDKFSKKELEKKMKKISFSINNGKFKKIYE